MLAQIRCGSENLTAMLTVLEGLGGGENVWLGARLRSSAGYHRCHWASLTGSGLGEEEGKDCRSTLGVGCWDSKWEGCRRVEVLWVPNTNPPAYTQFWFSCWPSLQILTTLIWRFVTDSH